MCAVNDGAFCFSAVESVLGVVPELFSETKEGFKLLIVGECRGEPQTLLLQPLAILYYV